MSRSRSDSLLLISGVLLLILVGLFFLTHRPSEPNPTASVSTPAGESPANSSASASPRDDSPAYAAPTDSDLALDATTAELSQKLSTRLTRPDTRAHEAVLLFKNADGYRRFLVRAAQVGVIIVGQIDALNVVRVRVRAYDTFAADLVARAADYGGISANTFVSMPPPPAERLVTRQVGVGNNLLATLGVPAATDTSAWGRGIHPRRAPPLSRHRPGLCRNRRLRAPRHRRRLPRSRLRRRRPRHRPRRHRPEYPRNRYR